MSEMNDAQSLRDLSELLLQLSAATGLSEDAIQTEVNKLEYAAFQFNDAILVSPADFEGIIDSWAAKLKADLRLGSTTSLAKKPKAATRKIAVAKTAKATTLKKETKAIAKTSRKVVTQSASAAKKVAAKKAESWAGALPLPSEYRSIVSHLYGPSLKRIMPEDEATQQEFLEAIANETEAGVELLDHLSVIIADKYTGKMAPESAYNGLKNKAIALLDGGVSPAQKTRGRNKTSRKPSRPAAMPKATVRAKAKTGRKPATRRKSKGATVKKPVSASSAPQTSVLLSEMELPKGYRKRVSNRYGPTLKSLLPSESTLRSAYLKEIISESNLGKSFLERVADSIKLKYRGKITSHTAYQGLLSKAQAM
jgi:hypothetical protein